jgi:tRNA (guanine26-N2/guanine27-N2)-dimethyltransferase
MGHILQCRRCPYREEHRGLHAASATCPGCGEPLTPIGPLWLGPIRREGITGELRALAGGRDLGSAKEIQKLLDACEEELPVPGFYDYHVLAKVLGCSPPHIGTVIGRIRDRGYAVSRTHFSGYGIKTDAPLDIVLAAVSAPQ